MRCWFLMLLLVFHHVTDFLPNNTRGNGNFSLCDSKHNHREMCNGIPKQLGLYWNGHMEAGRLITADCNNADMADTNSESDIVTSATLDENEDVLSAIKASEKPNKTFVCCPCELPAKIDSFEKWKYSQLSRYLNEQRKQKQSANSQTPGKTSQENDKTKSDDHNHLPCKVEQPSHDSEAGNSNQVHSNDKTSNQGSNMNAHQHNDGNFGNHHSLKKAARQRKNFANANCGAKIVASNAQAQNAKEILSENRDGYMLNPCKAKIWFIVELCERIQIESLELASFELFARVPKRFRVSATEEFEPTLMNGDPSFDSSDQHASQRIRWYDLGTFVFPSLKREIHRFNVSARHIDPRATAAADDQASSNINPGCGELASSQKTAHCENAATTQNSHGDIYELIHKLREEPYVKYVRFEMLEYEGTEHYCPLSLVRVYGSTLEEVINMHEQVDDSLIDALVSMPDSVGHASTVSSTAPVGRDIVNNHDPSSLGFSHYMFTLVQDVKQKRQISLKHRSNASLAANSTCCNEDCTNVMSDVEGFKILCTRQHTSKAESHVGDKGQPELTNYTNEGFRSNQMKTDDSGGLDKPLSSLLGGGNGCGQRDDDSIIQEVPTVPANHTQEDRNDLLDEARNRPDPSIVNEKPGQLDFNQSDPTMRRENISNLKVAVPSANGLSNQPVLVRYGNRLNLLELNTTLYAIYLDQLSQHYNAHMQDLTAKLQHVSNELKIQTRRNEHLAKLIERQAMGIELLEHRLRDIESKLYDQRYYYNGRTLPITLCCTVFVCLLTLLLSAALNSHQLFRACGQERCTVPTSDSTIEDQADRSDNRTITVVDPPHNMERCDDLPVMRKPALTIENALVVYLPKTVSETNNGIVSALTGHGNTIRVSPSNVDTFGEPEDKGENICLGNKAETSGHTFVTLTEGAGTTDDDCYVIKSKEIIGGHRNCLVMMQPLPCV